MTEQNDSPESGEETAAAVDMVVERVNYVRSWLDCAPDFNVLTESLLIKIALDRGFGAEFTEEEVAQAGKWVENFYKDLSAMLGIFEGHIVVGFPPGQRGPAVELTEKGKNWVEEYSKKAAEQKDN